MNDSFVMSHSTALRRVVFALMLGAFALIQQTPGVLCGIVPGRALLLIPTVLCIGMFERTAAGGLFGIIAGAIWDISSAGDGYNALILFLIAFVGGVMISYVMRNNLITALVLCTASVALYTVLYILVFYTSQGVHGIGSQLMLYYVPTFIYTVLSCIPIYFTVRALMKSTLGSSVKRGNV